MDNKSRPNYGLLLLCIGGPGLACKKAAAFIRRAAFIRIKYKPAKAFIGGRCLLKGGVY